MKVKCRLLTFCLIVGFVLTSSPAFAYENHTGTLKSVRVKANHHAHQALAIILVNSSGAEVKLCASASDSFGYRGTGDAGGEAAVNRLLTIATAAYLSGAQVKVSLNYRDGRCILEQMALDPS
jgi:hypothetical protein